jgi:dCMP deaminase
LLTSTTSSQSQNACLDKWDRRFLKIAHEVQSWSKDLGTKVGCVLVKDQRVIATGYNGFPKGLSDSLDLYQNRDFKLSVTVHAEANAIFNAAKNGANTESCTAYVTFPPCSQCAAALIQAGVEGIVCPDPAFSPERWRSNFQIASNILEEAGVKTFYYSEADLNGDTDVRHLRGPLG